MADAIGLTASLITLVATAYTSCQTLHNTFQGIRDAPKQIETVSRDLDVYCFILGSLQTLLNDESFLGRGGFDSVISVDIQRALNSSLATFAGLRVVLNTYKQSRSPTNASNTKRFKWTFRAKEINDLRNSLEAQKLTLSSAVGLYSL